MMINLLQVLLRASPSKLVEQLVEDTSSADPNYIEDFLLCHRFTFSTNLNEIRNVSKSCLRIFLDSSLEVVRQLLSWFESANLRDRVTRILLLWVYLFWAPLNQYPWMFPGLVRLLSKCVTFRLDNVMVTGEQPFHRLWAWLWYDGAAGRLWIKTGVG